MASAQELGIFDNNLDKGDVKNEGSAGYDEEEQVYTLIGSETNMWFGVDEFQYLWKAIQGDFILRTSVEFIGQEQIPTGK